MDDKLKQILLTVSQETIVEVQALLERLAARMMNTPELTEAQQAHVAAHQILVLLSYIDRYLSLIGDENFKILRRHVSVLLERERASRSKVAGLSNLVALFMPFGLTPTTAQSS